MVYRNLSELAPPPHIAPCQIREPRSEVRPTLGEGGEQETGKNPGADDPGLEFDRQLPKTLTSFVLD